MKHTQELAPGFLIFESIFDYNVPRSIQRRYVLSIEEEIAGFLKRYVNRIFIPQFRVRDLYFCQTDFYNGFMDYISEQLLELIAKREGLNNVRITGLKIRENFFSKELRLQEEAEGNIYTIYGREHAIGVTSDGHLVFLNVYYTVKSVFEPNTPRILQRLETRIIENSIPEFLRSYVHSIFIPQFTISDLYFCQKEFYNGFIEYISDQLFELITEFENLNSFRITKLEIIEDSFSKNLRLQRLEVQE